MGFLGALEAVRYRTVYGWAHDSCQSQPPTVRIQINGVDAGIAVADLPRPELLEMGVTSFHRGFEWSVPESFSKIDSVNILTNSDSRWKQRTADAIGAGNLRTDQSAPSATMEIRRTTAFALIFHPGRCQVRNDLPARVFRSTSRHMRIGAEGTSLFRVRVRARSKLLFQPVLFPLVG